MLDVPERFHSVICVSYSLTFFDSLVVFGEPETNRCLPLASKIYIIFVDTSPDLRQGSKKVRDPGFAESKVWDLDRSWTLHVLFAVGLWKPRTSKLCYAARLWKPRTSRFVYAVRP